MRIVTTLYPQNTTQTSTNLANERLVILWGPISLVLLLISVIVPSYRISSSTFANEDISSPPPSLNIGAYYYKLERWQNILNVKIFCQKNIDLLNNNNNKNIGLGLEFVCLFLKKEVIYALMQRERNGSMGKFKYERPAF